MPMLKQKAATHLAAHTSGHTHIQKLARDSRVPRNTCARVPFSAFVHDLCATSRGQTFSHVLLYLRTYVERSYLISRHRDLVSARIFSCDSLKSLHNFFEELSQFYRSDRSLKIDVVRAYFAWISCCVFYTLPSITLII